MQFVLSVSGVCVCACVCVFVNVRVDTEPERWSSSLAKRLLLLISNYSTFGSLIRHAIQVMNNKTSFSFNEFS